MVRYCYFYVETFTTEQLSHIKNAVIDYTIQQILLYVAI